MISLFVTFGERQCELRLHGNELIENVKARLHVVTGWSIHSMQLSLYDAKDRLICSLLEEGQRLDSYAIGAYYRIHVTSPEEKNLDFSNAEQVAKYELSQEAYMKLPDNAAKWKERLLKTRASEATPSVSPPVESSPVVELGDRVVVSSRKTCSDNACGAMKRGVVKYVGPVHFAPGSWIGVEYDEAIGKGDGSMDQVTYFEAKDKHGAFVKPELVHVVIRAADMDASDMSLLEEL